MKKGLIIGAALTLLSTPAFADTTAWGGVSAGINLDGGDGFATGRVGVDTTIGNGAFVGLALGAGESGVKTCSGLVCASGGREISAELRLGGMNKSGWKFYGLAGYSRLKITGKSGALTLASFTEGGVTGGAGIEAPLGSKVFTRLEFRYSDYGDGDHVTSIMPTIGFKF